VPAVDVAQYLGEYYREDLNFPEVSELDVVRHYTKLSQRNYDIDTTMVPLGSCTMKYNPKINEKLAKIEAFTQMHPNPNILGIFERKVKKLADALHQKDALLYMDGANFNAKAWVKCLPFTDMWV